MVKAVKQAKTTTLFCRGVDVVNKNFAMKETKKKGYKSIAKYVNALLDQERLKEKKRQAKK